jgi:histidinol dehydrogenase
MRRMTSEELKNNPAGGAAPEVVERARDTIAGVRSGGDAALCEYTRKFDGADIPHPAVDPDEIGRARERVDPGPLAAMAEAAARIERFARAQRNAFRDFEIEIEPGVFAGQAVIPLARAGVYVPGGRYPLFSSLLMGAIPARVAGVREIAVCTPPGPSGRVPDMILAAAEICGIREIYRAGGAQAVAAMAYGTESIPRVDKIVGPGNDYVTAAKLAVAGDVGIDFAAGPTELVVVADRTADPVLIAADLVAQAEHDVRASAILITDSAVLASRVEEEIEKLLVNVLTRDVARAALEAGGVIAVVASIAEAVDLANDRAPEHLELCIADATSAAPFLRNYGTLFQGGLSAEVLGDYSSGLNHILPTRGAARYTGGLSVRDFLKIQTVLRIENRGLEFIGPAASALARAEGLSGHALSVDLRLGRPT